MPTSPWTTTASIVAVAGLLGAAVYFTRPVPIALSMLSDQGLPLTPALSDPLAVKSLEVISFDTAASEVRAFKVSFDGTRWVIPSASNYPADAASKIAAAASAFSGLIKEQVVGDEPRDHGSLGVVAPDDEAAVAVLGSTPDAIGTRVTLRGADGRALADLVLGKPAGGGAGSGGRLFVRDLSGPLAKRTYVTTLAGGFSTKFVDWVETDLLNADPQSFNSIVIDRYRIDDITGAVTEGNTLTLNRTASASTQAAPDGSAGAKVWTLTSTPAMASGDGPVDAGRVDETLSALTGIRLVGVRAKPANLAKILSNPSTADRLSITDQLSLQTRGFFLSPTGQLLATDGQVQARTDDGLIYTIWIGAPVPEGEDAASGGEVSASRAEKTTALNLPAPAGVARYMMIMAGFDQAGLAEPAKPTALVAADQAAAENPANPVPPELAAQRSEFQSTVDDWKARTKSAQERAEQLGRRFADWYYVIESENLGKLRPTREELIQPPAPESPTVSEGVGEGGEPK